MLDSMMTDDELLAQIPDYVSFSTLMKATPITDGDERIVFVEASREEKDQDNEIVLSKALKDSSDHFKKFGVIDLDHKSMPAIAAKLGIDNPDEWVIGQPIDVGFDGDITFVKARLFSGDTPLANRANIVWDGLTKLNPPARYYASVGGAVLGREVRIDPKSNQRVAVITKTRWNNLAFSLNPVNQHLSPATTAPVGIFTKSLGGYILKSIEAGYGTDSSTITGGGAMRKQSLHGSPINYFDARNRASQALINKLIKKPSISEITKHANENFGMSLDESAEFCERFMRDIHKNLKRRKS